MKKFLLAFLTPFFFISKASAHCPLCTAGAGAAAGIATYLGIDFAVIGVFIGGFSYALGSWTSKWVRKKYKEFHRFQNPVVTGLIFLSIVVPGYFWMPEATPFTLWMVGEYGTTITINNFLAGSLIGGLIVHFSPALSKKISEKRDETLPYQGMTLTIMLLIIAAITVQLLVM